ncbi:hypothetical protein PQO03_16355 [Lentisphaera profundi]|uniref:Uncharacterized protein n=1 Tax=Lentisphaera profundi TaxID=1658616 RepID=A0ABY7VYT7_9BACT|nr:hypothetical protein [Lentisphaera profundi]WDE99410.1 hypothetical protein PQO03_16355 [Lentisphaera profundi]
MDPSLLNAWELKAKLHFIKQEFKQAMDACNEVKDLGPLAELNKKYSQLKNDDSIELSHEQYLGLLKELQGKSLSRQFANLIHAKVFSDLSTEERIVFCKGALVIHNLGMNLKHFSFDPKSKHLNVSGNKGLKTILCLQNFPALSADLSGTKIADFIGFRGQNLRSLNVSNTAIYQLQSLENKNLQELNISHTGVRNLSPIFNWSLRKLNISHTEVKDIFQVLHFPLLEELVIHEGQFSAKDLQQIPSSVKLIQVKFK